MPLDIAKDLDGFHDGPDLSVRDWEDRIRAGKSLLPVVPLCDAYADRAVAIFSRLRAPDVIDQPTMGEICEDWILDFVRVIFGTYDPETRARLVQEFFLMVPKKNFKSGLASGIMLTALIVNERPYAELVLVSETQKISGIAFRNIRGMIDLDTTLSDLFHVIDHQKKIKHLVTSAELQIVSADGDVVTGSKASFVLVDEAHVLGMKAKAPAVYLELRGGLASRPEGFFLQITTQSKVEPAGQFKKELDRARAVRDGTSKARLIAVLYEYPKDMAKSQAWLDPKTWGLVNPNLGLSVSTQYLVEKVADAQADGPDALALVASQHFNVEIGIGLHSERWVACDYWPSAADPTLGFYELLDRSEVVTIGGDGGGGDDLFSFAAMGRCPDTLDRLVWARAWCHPKVMEDRKAIAPKLLDLADVGDLVIEEDLNVHVEEFTSLTMQARDADLLPDVGAIGLDAWGASALETALLAEGFTEDQINWVKQGAYLNRAIKGIQRWLMSGAMWHGDQPLLTWCMGNAKVQTKGDNIYITKERAGIAKIDPLAAMFNAFMLIDEHPEVGGGRVITIGSDYQVFA